MDDGEPDREHVTAEELIALREGDLTADEEHALRARLEVDPVARELLATLAETDQILHEVRDQPPPQDVSDAIAETIAKEQARRSQFDDAGGVTGDEANGADRGGDAVP